MIFPCPNPPNRCEDSPSINLTSEDNDGPTFLASYFGNGLAPFLGTNFRQDSGVGFCTSLLSQSDADICSFRNQLHNQTDSPNDQDSGNWTDPQGNPYPIFSNEETSYTVFCPDGTPFVFTVPAGQYVALTQIEANRIAASFARLQANLNRVCLGTIQTNACANTAYSSGLIVTGRGPFNFVVYAGTIPPGIGISASGPNSAIVSGTPTTAGTYTFTIQVTNATGHYMRKDYTIHVLGFTESGALPDFTQNSAYSHQMAGTGGIAPYSFEDLGSLPPGLTISSDGLLSGTPTDSGDFAFSLAITDSSSPPNLCTANFTMHGNAVSSTLSAYWKFDETNGSRVDQKGGHDLTEIGGVTGSEPGIINKGSTYTGVIGRVLQSAANETFPGDWSISTWVLSRATHGAGQFDNLLFMGNIDDSTNQGQFSMGWYNSTVANGIFLTLISPSQFIDGVFIPIDMTPYYGSWTHLGFTWTAPTIRFYVNGVLMFTKDMSLDVLDFNSGLSQDPTPIAIGGAVNGTIIEHAFKGAVDETGTWDRLLSDAEMLTLYNGGAGLAYGSPGFPP